MPFHHVLHHKRLLQDGAVEHLTLDGQLHLEPHAAGRGGKGDGGGRVALAHGKRLAGQAALSRPVASRA